MAVIFNASLKILIVFFIIYLVHNDAVYIYTDNCVQ